MTIPEPYMPQDIFGVQDGDDNTHAPRVLITPHRYIQGDGAIDHIGRYLSVLPGKTAGVFISARGRQRLGERIQSSLGRADIDAVFVTFKGECSAEEVDRAAGLLRDSVSAVDYLVTAGGGKCLDAGKCVAARLNVPVVICPSLASNDAPCSACAVLYTPDGQVSGGEFFPASPAMVVVDTRIIAEAPVRFLVAGMGDAMSTWYEARACLGNPKALSLLGTRPTMAATALSELCAKTLLADGPAAVEAVRRSEVTDALERVVEANTLLSGIGFESGGLAAAHAVAHGFLMIPSVEADYLHGEAVALGVLVQLMLEDQEEEARRVAEFFAGVGLPVHLGQLALTPEDKGLDLAVEVALMFPYVANESFDVTQKSLMEAIQKTHKMGEAVANDMGDGPFQSLHK